MNLQSTNPESRRKPCSAALLLLLTLFGASGDAVQAQEIVGVVPEISQRPASEGKNSLPHGSVSGMVLCADTRTPSRNGRVLLLPISDFDGSTHGGDLNQPLFAITGLDGRFVVDHVPPAEYLVVAMAVGYLSPLDDLPFSSKPGKAEKTAMAAELRRKGPLVRIRGDEQAHVDIELLRGVEFSGRVIYSDGSPASQLPVRIEKRDRSNDTTRMGNTDDAGLALSTMVLHQRISTDDEGHFRLAGISPGSYMLAVSQSFDGSDLMSEMMLALYPGMAQSKGILTVYSGNELHRSKAKVYDVAAGDHVDGIEIVLPLNGLHALSGRATGVDGAALNAGTVRLTDTVDRNIAFEANLGPVGEFRFSAIPEGSYDLTVTHGRIYANPPQVNQFRVEFNDAQNDDQMDRNFKPLRAFANLKQSLIVGETNPDMITLTLTDTKLPELPKEPQGAPAEDDGPPEF